MHLGGIVVTKLTQKVRFSIAYIRWFFKSPRPWNPKIGIDDHSFDVLMERWEKQEPNKKDFGL